MAAARFSVGCYPFPSVVWALAQNIVYEHMGWWRLRETVSIEREQPGGKGQAISGKNYQTGFTTFIK